MNCGLFSNSSAQYWRTGLGGGLITVCVLYKLYSIYKNRLKLFNETNQALLKNIGILITGAGSGIGYETAIALNKKGYCVIATCRREESLDKFNRHPTFTKNGSFAAIMDVSDLNSIKKCKRIVLQWLAHDKDRILWSVINNAGLFQSGGFEIVPHKWMMYEYNVLLLGTVNVTRMFLPLIYGRRIQSINIKRNNYNYNYNYNYNSKPDPDIEKTNSNDKYITNNNDSNNDTQHVQFDPLVSYNCYSCGSCAGGADRVCNQHLIKYDNGGRIVNISSVTAFLPGAEETRYGLSKCAMSYLTHCLRAEYASTFGIWCCSIEAGLFDTKLTQAHATTYSNLIKYYYKDSDIGSKCDELKDGLSPEEKEIGLTFDIRKYCSRVVPVAKKLHQLLDNKHLKPCTDAIVHAVTAKHPKRVYRPGYDWNTCLLHVLPQWLSDRLYWTLEDYIFAQHDWKK